MAKKMIGYVVIKGSGWMNIALSQRVMGTQLFGLV